jgi:hypothetical protein
VATSALPSVHAMASSIIGQYAYRGGVRTELTRVNLAQGRRVRHGELLLVSIDTHLSTYMTNDDWSLYVLSLYHISLVDP